MDETTDLISGTFTVGEGAPITTATIVPVRWELRRVNEVTVDWFPVPISDD